MSADLGKQRVRFDFSEDAYARLAQLQERGGAESKAEVVRRAMRLYEWLMNCYDYDKDMVMLLNQKDGTEYYKTDIERLLK